MSHSILQEIKTAWGWIGIEPVKIIAENDFGNVIFEDKTNGYWRLCPEELSCVRIASYRPELDALLNGQEFQVDWLLGEFGAEVREAIGPLTGDKKYSLKIPAILGGEYNIDNVGLVPFKELIGFSGDLAWQLKDVPDGSKVKLEIIE